MNRLLCRLGIPIFLLVFAACGSEVAPPATYPAGYTVVEGDRVALALPPDWVGLVPTEEDFRQIAEDMRAGNPFLADQIAEMGEDVRADTFRLAGYAPDGSTTVNITSERVTPLQNTAGQAAADREGLESLGYVIVDKQVVDLNGEKAARTEAEIQVFTPEGVPFPMHLLQYTLVKNGRAYSISFGTPRFQYGDLEATFEQIAQTFHTVEN